MRKNMTILKKHAGVIVISIASLFLLAVAATFLSNTEIFSAKAEEDAVASSSDVSGEEVTVDGEEIVVPGDLYAMATANLDALAEGDTASLTEVPFTITHKDANGNDVPMILDEEETKYYNNSYGEFKWRIFDCGQSGTTSKIIYDNIDPRQSEYSGNLTAGHTIRVEFNYRNTAHHVDWSKIKIYYVNNDNKSDITYSLKLYSTSLGTMQYAEFVVRDDLPEGTKIVIDAPYVNRMSENKKKLNVSTYAVLPITLNSVNTPDDLMYGSITNNWMGTNTWSFSNNNQNYKYVFAGSHIKITPGTLKVGANNAFTFNGIKVYSVDLDGNFTVDVTSECLTENSDGKSYTLTMPNYDILVKSDMDHTLYKNEITVNCANGECTAINVDASRYSNGSTTFGAYNSSGYLYPTPESDSKVVSINSTSGEFWTNPEAAIEKSDAVYTFSIKGKLNVDPSPYDLKDIKVEALGEGGVTYTDVTDEVFISCNPHPTPNSLAYYFALKPHKASLRITCTMEQKPAHKVYFSETLAADGCKLHNEFYGNFLNADGIVSSYSSKTPSNSIR